MKKASFILIGLFLTVFLSSHFFIFKISQTVHQNQFRAFIKQDLNQLKKIDISPSQLYIDSKEIKWLDNNQEIMIGDMIYDVVCKSQSGTTISLFVMNDTDEKVLMDKYARLADSVFNESGPEKPNVIKDFLSLKFFTNKAAEIHAAATAFKNTTIVCYFNLAKGFLTQETPPPSILY